MKRSIILKTLIASCLLGGAVTFAIGTTTDKTADRVNASSLTNNGYDAGEYQYYTGNYYDSIGDSAIAAKGTTLLSALKSLIQPSSPFDYDPIWTFNESHDCYPSDYDGTDPLTGNSYPTTDNTAKRGKMWDMYSDKTWTSTSQRAGNVQSYVGGTYNREHSMPKSWFGGSQSNEPGTDPNHLFNTDGKVNGIRSNYAYGEVVDVKTNCYTMTSGCVGFGKLGTNSSGTTVFEPDDAYKGDFARAQMYMATAYYDWNLTQGTGESSGCFSYDSTAKVSTMKSYYINLLTKWSANDPVSQKEIDRNNAVYASTQKNRNPFIDHPGWANKIWGGTEYTWGKSTSTDPAVNYVTVSPTSATLVLGTNNTQQLTASVSVSNGASQAVTWNSNNTSVATVSNSGLVTAKAVGTTTITVTSTFDDTKYAECTITVSNQPAPTISLDKSEASITVGGNTTITATTTNGSGSITWTSSDTSVATVNNSGVVTGVAAGTATITATYSGVSATCAITVTSLSGSSSTFTCNVDTSSTMTLSKDGIDMAFESSGGTWSRTDNYRLYANKTLTISSSTKTITKIEFTISSGSFTLNSGGGSYSSGTWTGSSSSIVFGCSSQVRFTPVTITYAGASTPTLTSIAVQTAPTKTTYTAGEYFDPTGLVITRNYSSGPSDTYTYAGHTTEFTFDPSTSTALTTSDTSVTITYGGKSTSQSITVNKPAVTSISASVNKTFYVGETITKSDITVIDNNDDEVTDFTFSDYQFTYADAASGGALTNKTFTNGITYNTLSCSLTVQVQRKARVDTSSQNKSITYTDLPTSYQTSASERTATSGVKFIAYNLANYSSKMQFKASGGYFQTTEAMNLQSLTINNRETNALTVYGSTNGTSFSQSITGTNDVYDLTGYNFVKVMKNGSGAAYCSSLTITIGSADTATNLSNYVMYEDTNNQCTSKFSTAKGYFNNLTSAERQTFMTSDDYVIATARTRLQAWASNRGESINYSNNDYVISGARQLVIFNGDSNLLTIGLVLITIGSLIYAGTFVFKKKEK